MAIYRFRISFEDYDVMREIDIKSNQSFEDLHNAIHTSIGYKSEVPSSFYISNDYWHKGDEITIFPNERRREKGTALMSASKLHNFIEDPHQKFYYISNFDRPYDFHVELIRILIDADPNLSYPAVLKSSGEPPRQFSLNLTDAVKEESEEDIHDDLEEEEEEEERGDFASHGSESLDEEDTHGMTEKDGEEESSTESGDEEGFGDFGHGEDEDMHQGKEDY